MPKVTRSIDEVEIVREKIMSVAADLFVIYGYKKFSMRKLAQQLNISVTSIYNYYRNKDELYLHLLERGFKDLYERMRLSIVPGDSLPGQIASLFESYLDYGIRNKNMYDLMFSLFVPKYNDFIGSDVESVAAQELESALKPFMLVVETIEAHLADYTISVITVRDIVSQVWMMMHGYLSLLNSEALYYVNPAPESLRESVRISATELIMQKIGELKQNFYHGIHN